VEIAAFPLVPENISDAGSFVDMADATTPFFDFIEMARHRMLAKGDDNRTWYYNLVYWTSLSRALLAAKAIEFVSDARTFLDEIDDTSLILSLLTRASCYNKSLCGADYNKYSTTARPYSSLLHIFFPVSETQIWYSNTQSSSVSYCLHDNIQIKTVASQSLSWILQIRMSNRNGAF
jgi:hypothetical protein